MDAALDAYAEIAASLETARFDAWPGKTAHPDEGSAVLDRLNSMMSLAESAWRLRAVEETESPGLVASALYERGLSLAHAFSELVPRDLVATMEQSQSAVKLIYDPRNGKELEHRGVEKGLQSAIAAFEASANWPKLCDTLNSLGILCERRRMFGEARKTYERALATRTERTPDDHAGLAQAYISLANLLGDKSYFGQRRSVGDAATPTAQRMRRAAEVLPLYQQALERYLKAGLNRKSLHARRGLMRCHLSLGEFDLAQDQYDQSVQLARGTTIDVKEVEEMFREVEEELLTAREAKAKLALQRMVHKQQASRPWSRHASPRVSKEPSPMRMASPRVSKEEASK